MKTLKGQILDELNRRDYTLGELYEAFDNYNPRTVRECVAELKNSKLLKVTKCRCHGASIYEGKEGHTSNPWS
jgi:hypothetical protein